MPAVHRHYDVAEIEAGICTIACKTMGVKEADRSNTLEELSLYDSLDLSEFMMGLEERFGVTLAMKNPNAIYKSVFTRSPLRVMDLAEALYLQQENAESAKRRQEQDRRKGTISGPAVPFCQLTGIWEPRLGDTLYEAIPDTSPKVYRRHSDGMRCILIPAARVDLGSEAADALPDEGPEHTVKIDAFLMDAEPVSTTAYCRFLNSLGQSSPALLEEWFVLSEKDHRDEHLPILKVERKWRPRPGTERLPMVLVSWFGANAYSLWANNRPWVKYRDEEGVDTDCFLPSEAQWEYAARGARSQRFPWGNEEPSPERMRSAVHARGDTYVGDDLPMADVNALLGMSPFGLHHMAGNVWQWCRDWYSESFYERGDALESNPVNRWPTGIRSERGGSWVGPSELCRSSYRRGRPPLARGRCLGFRCVGRVQ